TSAAVPPQASAAQQQASAARDWQAEFRSMYALAPGQMLKRVPPPFISARQNFMREKLPNAADANPGAMALVFNRQDFALVSDHWERIDLGETLKGVADVWPQETDLSRAAIASKVTGDWVVRDGTTPGQRIDDLLASVPEIVGPGQTLARRLVLRDTIVARG